MEACLGGPTKSTAKTTTAKPQAVIVGQTKVRIMKDPEEMLTCCRKYGYSWSSAVKHMNGKEYTVRSRVRDNVIKVFDAIAKQKFLQDGLIFIPLPCTTIVEEAPAGTTTSVDPRPTDYMLSGCQLIKEAVKDIYASPLGMTANRCFS